MKINARHLILDLLLATQGQPLSAREAIAACRIFEISENSVRVALVRLSADGLIVAAGRGSYVLGPSANELAGDVATWRSAEQRVRAWSGNYVVACTSNLGRSDRTALRRRERALDMLGFRELEKDLHVRPDNLEGDIALIRQRLHVLGLEQEAVLFIGSQWGAE
ncbi:MAG: PaaX family transcriptional regulator, partial [Perlucidibaca sp.]